MAVKKKDTKIAVPISFEQKARWEKFADQKDMSLASFVRNCVEAYIHASERLSKERGNG